MHKLSLTQILSTTVVTTSHPPLLAARMTQWYRQCQASCARCAAPPTRCDLAAPHIYSQTDARELGSHTANTSSGIFDLFTNNIYEKISTIIRISSDDEET